MGAAEADLLADVISILAVATFLGTVAVSLLSEASLEAAFIKGAMAFAVVGILGWLALRVWASSASEALGADAAEIEED